MRRESLLFFNIASQRGLRLLNRSGDEVAASSSRLGSGKRINTAADDAAGLAIASSLNVESRVYTQGIRNLNDGLSLLAIKESALSSMVDITIRLEELAEQAANGVYSGRQRSALDGEAKALTKELDRIVQSTSFTGIRVFGAEAREGIRLQAGFGLQESLFTSGASTTVGTGTFTAGPVSGTNIAGLSGLALGDFNGDGKVDSVTNHLGFPGALVINLGQGESSQVLLLLSLLNISFPYTDLLSGCVIGVQDMGGTSLALFTPNSSGALNTITRFRHAGSQVKRCKFPQAPKRKFCSLRLTSSSDLIWSLVIAAFTCPANESQKIPIAFS